MGNYSCTRVKGRRGSGEMLWKMSIAIPEISQHEALQKVETTRYIKYGDGYMEV